MPGQIRWVNTFHVREGRTFNSVSSCVAARLERAAVSFGTLGREICLWNSDISRAVVKTVTSSLIAAFKVATGSGLLDSIELRQAGKM